MKLRKPLRASFAAALLVSGLGAMSSIDKSDINGFTGEYSETIKEVRISGEITNAQKADVVKAIRYSKQHDAQAILWMFFGVMPSAIGFAATGSGGNTANRKNKNKPKTKK